MYSCTYNCKKKCIKINFPEIIHQIEVCKFQEFSAYSKALEICLYKYVCTYILPTMSNNVPTRILYSAHKICGKKHAIGYIHEILILDLKHQVISIFPHFLQNLFVLYFLVQKLEALIFMFLITFFSHFIYIFLDMIT